MTENVPQINDTHQTTDPGSWENTKQDKCPEHYNSAYSFQTTENQRQKEILEEARVGGKLSIQEPR